MPANASPIFGAVPNVGSAVISAVCTKSDGAGTIGTDIFKVFTAGSNGAWLNKARFTSYASTAATATNATTCRLFLSSAASGATTSANCWLIAEINLPVVTADHSTNPTNPQEFPLNFAIPAGYTVLATMHLASAANTGVMAMVFGADY